MSTLTRRRLLRNAGLTGAGLAGAALLGCGASEDESTPAAGATGAATTGTTGAAATAAAASGAPKTGGTLRYSAALSGDNDPHTSTTPVTMTLWGNISKTLLKLGPDNNIYPNLVESEEMADGGQTLIFKIPANITWDERDPLNGRAFTAEDVKYSLERMATDEPGFTRATLLKDMLSVDVPDDVTVQIKLRRPSAIFRENLANIYMAMVPREAVEKFGDLKKADAAFGFGPFVLDQYSEDAGFSLKRNPNYYKPGLPYLDAVEYLQLADASATLAAFTDGQLLIRGLSVNDRQSLGDRIHDYELMEKGSNTRYTATMRHNAKPWDDQRVRMALNLAIDRGASVQSFFQGAGEPIGTVAWSLTPFATPPETLGTIPGYTADKEAERAEAKKLLAAAGYPDGVDVNVLTANLTTSPGSHAYIGQFIQDQGRRVGLNFELELQEYTAYKKRANDREFEVTADPYASSPNADEQLTIYASTGGSRNYGEYSNPQLDALIDAEQTELDHERRVEIIREAQKLCLDDIDHAWMSASTVTMATHKSVKDFVVTGNVPYDYDWETVWLDA